jgi:nucleoside-diphosphate-sugar epimerase
VASSSGATNSKPIAVGVTGVSGFIGGSLLEYLHKSDYLVKGFSRESNSPEICSINYKSEIDMANSFKGLRTIVHCAWVGSQRTERNQVEIQNINLEISRNLVTAANLAGVKHIIAIGSQAEFRNSLQPWMDNSFESGDDPYAAAKIESYKILRGFNGVLTWARAFSVYGKTDRRDWIVNSARLSLLNSTPIAFGSCNQPWSLTHINDFIRAVELLILNPFQGKVNIANLDAPVLSSHLLMMEQISGQKDMLSFSKEVVPSRAVYREKGAIESLGWEPRVSLRDGLGEILHE